MLNHLVIICLSVSECLNFIFGFFFRELMERCSYMNYRRPQTSRKWIFFILFLYLTMSWFRGQQRIIHQPRQPTEHSLQSGHPTSRVIRTVELFQVVISGSNDVLVFSAFQFKSMIMIVAILDMASPERTYNCVLWGMELPSSGSISTATLQICPESHGTRYGKRKLFYARFVSCKEK